MTLVEEFLQLSEGKGGWRSSSWKVFNEQCYRLVPDDNYIQIEDCVTDFGGWLMEELERKQTEVERLRKLAVRCEAHEGDETDRCVCCEAVEVERLKKLCAELIGEDMQNDVAPHGERW